MYVDLLTLYLLAIGTLLVGAGMTFWEHRTHPKRGKALRLLAAGFATLAAGCAGALFRRDFPGAIGSAASNLVVMSGYLLILNGVAALSGRQYRAASAGLLAVTALAWAVAWAVAGARGHEPMWNYVSGMPIALVSGMTAWEMLRCNSMKTLQSRYIVVAAAGVHAFVYAARAVILPWLVAKYGPAMQAAASSITIYEGVLYSVILPMALIKVVREETHGQLLRESQTDYLTRLGNRRWFFEEGARIIGSTGRHGPVAVLAFDLDRFKAINDLYGHDAGDKVLASFADIARGVLGPHALLARIGGEEFAALLSGDDALRAGALGDTVARRFAETIHSRIDSIAMPATVSIGLAKFESGAPSLDDALACADRALYRAKSLGGNRLESAETAALPATG